MPKVEKRNSLSRTDLATNLNTKKKKMEREMEELRVSTKQNAFVKMLPVLMALHNTPTPADRLLPNITLGKKGEFDKYDPSKPFSAADIPEMKPVKKKGTPSQKTTKKHFLHRGGRKSKKTRKTRKNKKSRKGRKSRKY